MSYEENKKYGFVIIYRSVIRSWGWRDDVTLLGFFVYCILRANYRDAEYHGIMIKRGSFLTSYKSLASDTGLTIHKVRTAIEKLEKFGEISARSENGKYTVISITNYDKYQDVGQADGKLTASYGQADGKLTATDNKRINNNKRKNKENGSTSFAKKEDVEAVFDSIGLKEFKP